MHTFAQEPKTTSSITPVRTPILNRLHFEETRNPNSILHLQRTIGNQAVSRLLNSSAGPSKAGSGSAGFSSPSPVVLQRKCACGGTGGDCAACAEEKETTLHRSAANPGAPNGVPPIVHDVLRSPGQRLDAGARSYMEPRFGHDFSGVSIHDDAQAAESAQAVNALAYTVGNHIVFGAGQYAPQTVPTNRLLAHELAHVVQQGSGQGLQKYGISSPGDHLEQQASLAEEAVMADKEAPPLTGGTSALQRQTGDPLGDPLAEDKKPKEDPATARVNQACGKPCGMFPWVEVAPDVFFTLCDDTPTMGRPVVATGGCTPGRLGNVALFSGSPAWQMPAKCDTCKITGPGSKAGPTTGMQIGYIQTVEQGLSGGVYFKQDPSGKWVWAGNDWLCVANARDSNPQATAPWYGPDANKNFGPEPFGTCPTMADTPFVKLPSGQSVTTDKAGITRAAWPLRRLRIDAVFHTWLVAQPATGPMIFIHNWSFQNWVVADLDDQADPCNRSGWLVMNMNKVTSSGPGKGTATPVLAGGIANNLKVKC